MLEFRQKGRTFTPRRPGSFVYLFFFFFLRLFYSESVGRRPRIWGGTVNLLRKPLQPGCSPGGEEEGAVNKLCDLPAQGMSA